MKAYERITNIESYKQQKYGTVMAVCYKPTPRFSVLNIICTINRSQSVSVINDDTTELERSFHLLASQWKKETRKYSTMIHKTMNNNYIDIMSLNVDVVPLILKELKKKPDHWFVALNHFARKLKTGDPVPKEHLGNIEKMREDWLRWGEELGYQF